jgi:hypothetical protein
MHTLEGFLAGGAGRHPRAPTPMHAELAVSLSGEGYTISLTLPLCQLGHNHHQTFK